MSPWKDTTLGEFVVLQRGHDLTEPDRRMGNVPVMGSVGQNGFHDTARANGPGIVIGRSGASFGQVHFSPVDYWPHNTALYVTDFKGNYPRFVFYFLKALDFTRYNSGSAQPSLNRNFIYPIPVRIPPLPDQKAIAAVLGALDDKIELNRRMNATLEAMARALFQSWFVDFDPVRAKSEGRPPAGLDEPTAAQFQGSDLGETPQGWRVASIDELAEINGWTLGKSDKLETLEYVEISEVSAGNIANVATYERGNEPSRARRRLRHGDSVLSTVRPDRRSYFLALDPPTNRVASTGFAVITPTKASWSFIHSALVRDEVFERLGHLADGGAYPAVRPEVIGALKVAMPHAPAILDAFHAICGPLFDHTEANREQSRTLATLRDTLLPKLLSGELSVGKVAEIDASLSIGPALLDEFGELHVQIDGRTFHAGEKYTILELGWAVYLAAESVSEDWMRQHGETRPPDEYWNELASDTGSLVTSHPTLVALALRAWWHRNGRRISTAPRVEVPAFEAAIHEVRQREILNSFNQQHAGTVPGLGRWKPSQG